MKLGGRRLVAVLITSLIAAAAPVAAAAPANAAPRDFYSLPDQTPSERGAIVRTEPMTVVAAIPKVGVPFPVSAKRVMYSSRTEDNTPIAVTGTFVDAVTPWTGRGPRPTVVIAPGTQGQGDQCAPSRAFATGLYAGLTPPSLSANQELASTSFWHNAGARVFVTDYIGLGTPGMHTYVNRVEQAHAVLDAARAANRLSGSDSRTPVALWGYSQGGGATAAAAELAATYAPELNIKGVWAGGPTADLKAVLARIDGNLIGGAIGFAINGFVARSPELKTRLRERATPAGLETLRQISTECIGDVILRQPFLRTATLTKDHRSMLSNLATIPEAQRILDAQRIGFIRPAMPVLVTSGLNDDTVPYGQARAMAQSWCRRGATVTFRTNTIPPILPGTTIANHFGPEIVDGYFSNGAIAYLLDRFADRPLSGCTIR